MNRRVVIGKDTRISGYMIETAPVAGFTSIGMDVLQLGPMPSPAVAMLTRAMRADLGVMISASHNPFDDNGIKFFGPDGFKLTDDREHEIEALMDPCARRCLPRPTRSAAAKRIESVRARYVEFVKRTLPRELSLEGLRVVVDCANGAALQGRARSPVGARRGSDRDRRGAGRIQHQSRRRLDGAGGAAPQGAGMRADIGIALDGDADRVLSSTRKGG